MKYLKLGKKNHRCNKCVKGFTTRLGLRLHDKNFHIPKQSISGGNIEIVGEEEIEKITDPSVEKITTLLKAFEKEPQLKTLKMKSLDYPEGIEIEQLAGKSIKYSCPTSENIINIDFMEVDTEPKYQDKNEEGVEDFIASETTVKEELICESEGI